MHEEITNLCHIAYISSMFRHASSLERTPAKVKPITLLFALRKLKILSKRNLASINRVRYFYRGHVSYDVIIRTIVKPQMGWEWLPQANTNISVVLCLYSPCSEWANL